MNFSVASAVFIELKNNLLLTRMLSVLLMCLLWLNGLNARVLRGDSSERDVLPAAKRPWEEDDCPIYKNEALHAVVDRICEMCHEMFRHEDPNLRAKCRYVSVEATARARMKAMADTNGNHLCLKERAKQHCGNNFVCNCRTVFYCIVVQEEWPDIPALAANASFVVVVL
ncbi:unnamed protein product [Soboliphyme baturini]|uniref:Protein quiver n=1 Tax=Soboliphyme baturini TaxID=241478 RepID=A0A183ICE4_9BILA|nr:unnamed protein product [Soboliphyme baturini]